MLTRYPRMELAGKAVYIIESPFINQLKALPVVLQPAEP
jgi:hypothetical protein